jgi:predicted transcriptional regulator
MTKTAAMTLRLTQDLKDKIARLADETDRTPSAVAQRGLSDYVDYQLWMLEEIEKSREDFRQGRTVPHDEVMAKADAILAQYKSDAA